MHEDFLVAFSDYTKILDMHEAFSRPYPLRKPSGRVGYEWAERYVLSFNVESSVNASHSLMHVVCVRCTGGRSLRVQVVCRARIIVCTRGQGARRD